MLSKDRSPDGSITWYLETNKENCSICKNKLTLRDAAYYCLTTKELFCFDCEMKIDHSRYINKKKNEPHIHYKVVLRRGGK